jgi:hypothetical protein
VLHAIACAKVPIQSLLQVALAVFPEKTLQRDDHGMLPLHHVLLAKHPYATQRLVSALLQHSPEAAQHRMPNEGPTPLSLALHAYEIAHRHFERIACGGLTCDARHDASRIRHVSLYGGSVLTRLQIVCHLFLAGCTSTNHRASGTLIYKIRSS